jgi:ADP-dependent NAD(P)H-hydrate dehydratase / NAD(P)H-hydrate epimerase
MLKILSVDQIRKLDAYTIQHEPVASIDLMERAARAFTGWLVQRFDTSKTIGVICGTGNNGGDGLAIARMLKEWNYNVHVWIVRGMVNETDDFNINLQRLKGKTDIAEIITESDKGLFKDCDVLIDAIFGTGLSRPVEGIYAQAIRCMNDTDAIRVAVDIPSGLMAEKATTGSCVRAHHTVSFQLPKLAFFLPENNSTVGEWHLVRIGLDKEYIQQAPTNFFLTEKKDIAAQLKLRHRFDHKGVFGKALIIAGSYGKMGAAVLASRACLRSGVGLLTTHVPVCGYTILQTAVPEGMVSVDAASDRFSGIEDINEFDAIGIGPGLGTYKESREGLHALLENASQPLVLDADALNILAQHRELLGLLPKNSILTPHPGEFARLVDSWKNDFERLEKQQQLAAQTGCIVVLKGGFTSIAASDGSVYFNPTGNPGMATAGSGDVLTGILTGLLAQGYDSRQAAVMGVYLHGLSGDLAAAKLGQQSLLASDVIDYLAQAYRDFR